MTIFEIMREKICKLYNFGEEEVTESTRIVEYIHSNNLDLVDLRLNIEETFDITITGEQLGNISTIGDVVNFITSAKEKVVYTEDLIEYII